MKYVFPHIETLQDVLPIIQDRKEFILVDKQDYKIVNYVLAGLETFPQVTNRETAILRECRGLVFDKKDRLIARRLHKFFNVGERDETQSHMVDISQQHRILEKLDGSMITPLPIGDLVRFGTKMGITDTAMNAEEFIAKNMNILDFSKWLLKLGFTPIFEWCSRKNRIVIDYPEDRLVLLAVRNTVTGEYEPYEKLQEWRDIFGLDIVNMKEGSIASMESFIQDSRGLENAEGWVIRFEDGHMLKIKGDWYVKVHKTKDMIGTEKNVIDLIVNEKLDDVKQLLQQEDNRRLSKFETQFWHEFNQNNARLQDVYEKLQTVTKGDKKTFAVEYASNFDPVTRSMFFALWNKPGVDLRQIMLATIARNTGTQTRIDQVRVLWNGVKWDNTTQG